MKGGLQITFEDLRGNFHGAPKKLLVICVIQIAFLLLGVFIGHGAAECDVSLPSGSSIVVECGRCRLLGRLRWRDIMLLVGGLAAIFVGMYAAAFRNQHMCKIYGGVMMVYAFIIGLTAILTGLETPVLEAAASAVPLSEKDCITIAFMMVDNARDHAIVYGLNCVLDCAGAAYAIWSKQLFDYEEVASAHAKAQRQVENNM